MKTHPARQRAFTLLEIMLVVMIISILAAAAIHLMGSGPIQTTGHVAARTNAQTLKTAIIQYQTITGRAPTEQQGLAALVVKPVIEPLPRKWIECMEKVPLDPWDRSYVYRNPGKRKPNGYDVFSVGPDGLPDTEDDVYPE